MARSPPQRTTVAKLSAVAMAGCLALSSITGAALGQPVEAHALAYVSIPLDGSTEGAAYGLRFDLPRREGAEVDQRVRRPRNSRSLLEVRFGSGDEPGEVRLPGSARVERLGLSRGTTLWIWGGLSVAALVALAVAADAVCIGINTGCSDGNKDDKTD